MILYLYYLLIASFLSSCSLPEVRDIKKEASQTFRKDLLVNVNGTEYKGVGVLPLSTIYDITLYPLAKINRIIIQSCNREVVVDQPKKDGWFKNSYNYKYIPLPGIETRRACNLEIAMLEKQGTYNAFAFFEFQDEREEISLEANMQCNGKMHSNLKGVGVCQGAQGLKQRIFFKDEVIASKQDGDCDILQTENNFIYEFNLPKDKCVIYFVSNKKTKNGLRKSFRLSVVGYTSIPYYE